MIHRFVGTYLMLLFFILSMACSPSPPSPDKAVKTPFYHAEKGFKLLRMNQIDAAAKAFAKARQLKKGDVAASIGLALVQGEKGRYQAALAAMKNVADLSLTPQEMLQVHKGYLWLLSKGREQVDEDWFSKSETHFKAGVAIAPYDPELHYYMGMAFKFALRFNRALNQLQIVKNIKQTYYEEAMAEYEVVRKIRAAMPESPIARNLSIVKRITRGNMASLLVNELKLAESISPTKPVPSMEALKDVDHLTNRADIEELLKYNIKALSYPADGLFRPQENVTQGAFAAMLADLYVKLTAGQSEKGGGSIPTKALTLSGLDESHSYEQEIKFCIAKALLTPPEAGIFHSQATLSGADAVLGIRRLRNAVRPVPTPRIIAPSPPVPQEHHEEHDHE